MSNHEELINRGYKSYENDEIRVFWNPNVCQHAAKCIQGNTAVFDPKRRPWIDLSQASAKEIAALIDQCPSKALLYELKNPISIIFEEAAHRSVAYKREEQIGECEFRVLDNTWTITHTGVRPGYEGQGIAKMLVENVIKEARVRKARIFPLCSYARKMMTGKNEYKDVLCE